MRGKKIDEPERRVLTDRGDHHRHDQRRRRRLDEHELVLFS
jgi:hypothetical protein